MISFIIIGKNEGWKLTQCIESIFSSIIDSNLSSYEIIYVDSNSEDDSIERCLKFSNVRIFKLTDRYNPPIARNIGASKSEGEILFFLDADMTINPNFINKMMIDGNLIHPLVAGRVNDKILGKNREVITEMICHESENSYLKLITGGAFVIEKKVWDSIGGMDNRFVKGADPELGIRLASKGVYLLNLPYLFVVHHNDKYSYNKGIEINLSSFKKSVLFSSMLTYRKNLLLKYAWKRMYSHEKSFIALVISIILSVMLFNLYWMIIYLAILLLRSIIKSNGIMKFYKSFLYHLWRDVYVLIGYFTFFPKKIKLEKIKTQKLN